MHSPIVGWIIENILYTECTTHSQHFPNIELRPLLPSEHLPFVRAWTLQGVESVPQECWPMLTPMLPTVLCQGNCSAWQIQQRCSSWHTQTGAAGTYCTTIPRSKERKSFVLPAHPLNGTHTQSMSQLSQGLTIHLEPVFSTSSTLI